MIDVLVLGAAKSGQDHIVRSLHEAAQKAGRHSTTSTEEAGQAWKTNIELDFGTSLRIITVSPFHDSIRSISPNACGTDRGYKYGYFGGWRIVLRVWVWVTWRSENMVRDMGMVGFGVGEYG